MSDIQKFADYQREAAKMAVFISTERQLAGCVDPALLKAGIVGSQLQSAGMISPPLARFIAEQNSMMQKLYPGMAVPLYTNTYKFAGVTSAASSFTKTMELANRLARDWEESPRSMGECPEISVEDARAVVEEVKPYLPTDVTEAVECEISKAKTSDEKLVHIDWVKVIEILLPILLFIAGQMASKAHEQKEEAFWEETKAYQQESLETQKEDVRLKQELLDYLKDSQNHSVRVCDSFESVYDSSENAHDTEQHIVDSPDSQDHLENQNALQQQTDH